MDRQIIECVPNFSEGRRPQVIEAIVAAIKSSGATVLDQQMDAAHNRAVVTLVGDAQSCLEGAFRAVKKASELIDLNAHRGEHPRIGATDVCPLVPISQVTLEECARLAHQLAQRIATELNIPIYLYEAAATRPERENLAQVRQGEFEGLREAIRTDPSRKPDYGPGELHPTAGATAVGARVPLVAYNVNLRTDDVQIAKKIARALRNKDGGLRYCKALGFAIKEKQCAQVSMNMTNYQGTGLHRAFAMVKREAQRYGVAVMESEIIGLVPQQALIDAAVWYLQLDSSFQNRQILEHALAQATTSPAPTKKSNNNAFAPALSAAIGLSLLSQVAKSHSTLSHLQASLDQTHARLMDLAENGTLSGLGEAMARLVDMVVQSLRQATDFADHHLDHVQSTNLSMAALHLRTALESARLLWADNPDCFASVGPSANQEQVSLLAEEGEKLATAMISLPAKQER